METQPTPTMPITPPPDTCECPDDCRIDHENA